MSEPIIEQLDTAILKAKELEGFIINSIDVRPMTHIALLKHLGLLGVAKWVEQYQGFNVNITYSLSKPFRVNVDRKPTFEITSFKFKEIGANEWQCTNIRAQLNPSDHIKAAVDAIIQPNH